MSIRLISVLVLALALVTGCGFHLRGKVPLSPKLANIQVDSTDKRMRAALTDALRFSGAVVSESKGGATAVVKLVDVVYERKVRSIDNRGKATSYTLFYRVDFLVENPKGESMMKRRKIQTNRDFNFDANQVLQKESEELFLREDMERDLAQQILRQLSTIASATPIRVRQVS